MYVLVEIQDPLTQMLRFNVKKSGSSSSRHTNVYTRTYTYTIGVTHSVT